MILNKDGIIMLKKDDFDVKEIFIFEKEDLFCIKHTAKEEGECVCSKDGLPWQWQQ